MMIGRERASVEEGREGGSLKGTSEEGTDRGMDGARERGEGGSEEASVGGTERGREGNFKGGTGLYPDEGTGQVHNREPGLNRVTI